MSYWRRFFIILAILGISAAVWVTIWIGFARRADAAAPRTCCLDRDVLAAAATDVVNRVGSDRFTAAEGVRGPLEAALRQTVGPCEWTEERYVCQGTDHRAGR
jgi:hypothetical protein